MDWVIYISRTIYLFTVMEVVKCMEEGLESSENLLAVVIHDRI
jgi:hypothetical protein